VTVLVLQPLEIELLRWSDKLLGRITSSAKASAKDSARDYDELFNTHYLFPRSENVPIHFASS
jgi:hypothetical protein